MKLTQELIVTIVFLIGSWVVLSVVAVAFPPSASSIRQALSRHASQPKAEPTISPEAIAEPATTYYQEENIPVVQVVSGNPEKNEIFILAENEAVPEKMIEENPAATIAVLGGDEETANRHIEKFNIAAKNVAIKLALAKETLIRQAEADTRKLQEWKEWSERQNFAVDTKAKKFELPIEKLNTALKQIAEQPERVLPKTGLESPVDDNNTHAKAKAPSNNIAAMTEWKQTHLQAAMKFITGEKSNYSAYKQAATVTQHAVSQPVNVAFAKAAKEAVSDIRNTQAKAAVAKPAVKEEPKLESLHEQLGLNIKDKSYRLTGLQELNPALSALASEQPNVVEAAPVQVAENTVKAPVPVAAPASKKLALKAKVLSQDKKVEAAKTEKQFVAPVLAQAAKAEAQPVKRAVAASVKTEDKAATPVAASPVTTPASVAMPTSAAAITESNVSTTQAVSNAEEHAQAAEPVVPTAKAEEKVEQRVSMQTPLQSLALASIQPQASVQQQVNDMVKSAVATEAKQPVVSKAVAAAPVKVALQSQTDEQVVTIVKGPVSAEAKSATAHTVKVSAKTPFKAVIKPFVPEHVAVNTAQGGQVKRIAANTKPKITPVNYSAEQLAAMEQAKTAKHEKMVKRERALRNLERQLETEPMNISQPQVAERKVDAPAPISAPARVATHQAAPHARYQEQPRSGYAARRQQSVEERPARRDNSNDFNDDFASSHVASNRDPSWEYETYGHAREFNDAEDYSRFMEE